MKKKLISLTALLILSCMMFTSCITSMLGDIGITMAPGAETKPKPDSTTAPEETEKGDEAPVYGSRPSYSGIKFSDYISVDYKGITFEVDMLPPEITDKVVDANLSGLIDYYVKNYGFNCKSTRVTEGVVEEWDFVEIGFVGKIDGVAFDGGSTKENETVNMIVNEHDSGYIPGFADGIIGASVGTTVEVPVTFPENYRATNLAGKNAVFEITVYGKTVYDITDATIESLTETYKTVDEFKKYLKEEYIPELYDANLFEKVTPQIIDTLCEKAALISYPNDQFLYYYNSYVNHAYIRAAQLGLSYEDYVAQTGENDDALREKAKKEVLKDMIVYYVLEAEGKTYTDDEYNKILDDYIEYYKNTYYTSYDRATIEAMFEQKYYPGYLRYQFNLERVYQIAYESAKIVVKN